jgi:hypothetical protein
MKAMLDFENYSRYSPVLFKLKNLEKESKMVLHAIRDYYLKYPDQRYISVDSLRAFFDYQNPVTDKPDNYDHLFRQLANTSLDNAALLTDILKANVETHLMSRIGQVANDVVSNVQSTGMEQVEKLIQEYKDISGNIHDVENDVCDLSLAELLNEDDAEGLSWKLTFLNEHFGPLKHSTLGHIFARPDAGKTSLSVQHACFFAYQLKASASDRCVLYLNNEESINRIRVRGFCVVNKQRQIWLKSHMPEAEKKFTNFVGKHLKFIGSTTHIDQVRRYLDAFNPRVVFIDQGAKVDIPGKEDGVQRLQKLYNMYRNLAGEYQTSIITLGQADNAAEGKKFLNLNNLDASKVNVPGELDWCLGIGKRNDAGYEEVRYLNICKNKLLGRYGREQVTFDPLISTYKD